MCKRGEKRYRWRGQADRERGLSRKCRPTSEHFGAEASNVLISNISSRTQFSTLVQRWEGLVSTGVPLNLQDTGPFHLH